MKKLIVILSFVFVGNVSLRGMEVTPDTEESSKKEARACALCYKMVNRIEHQEEEKHSKICLAAPARLYTVLSPSRETTESDWDNETYNWRENKHYSDNNDALPDLMD